MGAGRETSCPRALIEQAWRKAEGATWAAAAFEAALLAVAQSRGLELADCPEAPPKKWRAISRFPPERSPRKRRRAKRVRALEHLRSRSPRSPGRYPRVSAARRAKARILLDGNQGLTPKLALKLVDACLKDGPVELLEQPRPKSNGQRWRH